MSSDEILHFRHGILQHRINKDYIILKCQTRDLEAIGALEGRMSASAQYARLNGKGYGKLMYKVKYQGIDIGAYASIIDNNTSQSEEKMNILERKLENSEKFLKTIK